MASDKTEGSIIPLPAVAARRRITMNQRDIHALCERMLNTATMASVETQVTSDLRLGANLIKELWRRGFNSYDQVYLEIARQ